MSEWTVATLKEHNDALSALREAHRREIAALREQHRTELQAEREKALEAALFAVNRENVTLAATQKEQRAAANEWRGALQDERGSRKGMKELLGWIVAGISLAFVAAEYFKKGMP